MTDASPPPCTCRLKYGGGNDPDCPKHAPNITQTPKVRGGPRVTFKNDGSLHIEFNAPGYHVEPPGFPPPAFTPAPGAGSFGRSTSPTAMAGGVGKPPDPLVIWEKHDTEWTPAVVHVFGDRVRITIGGDNAGKPGRYVDLTSENARSLAERIRIAAAFLEGQAP